MLKLIISYGKICSKTALVVEQHPPIFELVETTSLVGQVYVRRRKRLLFLSNVVREGLSEMRIR